MSEGALGLGAARRNPLFGEKGRGDRDVWVLEEVKMMGCPGVSIEKVGRWHDIPRHRFA